ncbi:MAG: membrane protein [Candidatus Pelagibacterales bacterium]|nr:MAG: membrane protein [Pelagibacterales bacterium]
MSKQLKFILSIFFILSLFFASFYIKDFRIDASSDSLVSQNDEDFKYFSYYQDLFPTKNSLVIAIKSNDKIDRSLLEEIEKISKKLSALPEVYSVFNINKAPILLLNKTNLLDLANDNYETIIDTNLAIKDVLNEFAKSPIYSDQIINENKNITSIVIFLNENNKALDLKENKNLYLSQGKYYSIKTEIDKERNELIKKIRNIINNSNKDFTYYLGGVEMISSDVISYVKNDILTFSLIVLLIIILILFLIFRRVKWVFAILFTSISAVYLSIGLAGFINFEITAVSANFLSLMFVLSISMNVHIMNNYLQRDIKIIENFRMMFWPCFYTFLTTIVAFVSLVISDIKPVIDFGIIMIIALLIVLISSFVILPLIVSFFSKEEKSYSLNLSFLKSFYPFAYKNSKYILGLNFLIFFISLYGITNLNVENSFIKYFKKNTEIYKGMYLIDNELGGTTPLDIILKFKNDDQIIDTTIKAEEEDDLEIEDDFFSDDLFEEENNIWFTNEKIETIKFVHQYLESRIEIGKVTSIYSLIDTANQINKSDLSMFELSVLYNEIPIDYKTDLIDPYLNVEKNMIKISTRVKDSKDIKRNDLINDINSFLLNEFDNLEEFKVNGLLVLYNNMLKSLFSSQIKSLGFVILAIFIMFVILFRSLKLSIIGIIPNIFASTFILGLIGLLKIPLDIMTITIAAISIGIAVDNTIHYIYRYKENLKLGRNHSEMIEKTHLTVGNAVLITSIAITAGFLTLCLSNFVPTVYFGLFTSLAMIFAMIGVLITLPSILKYQK